MTICPNCGTEQVPIMLCPRCHDVDPADACGVKERRGLQSALEDIESAMTANLLMSADTLDPTVSRSLSDIASGLRLAAKIIKESLP